MKRGREKAEEEEHPALVLVRKWAKDWGDELREKSSIFSDFEAWMQTEPTQLIPGNPVFANSASQEKRVAAANARRDEVWRWIRESFAEKVHLCKHQRHEDSSFSAAGLVVRDGKPSNLL